MASTPAVASTRATESYVATAKMLQHTAKMRVAPQPLESAPPADPLAARATSILQEAGLLHTAGNIIRHDVPPHVAHIASPIDTSPPQRLRDPRATTTRTASVVRSQPLSHAASSYLKFAMTLPLHALIPPTHTSLAVVGAHHFGGDTNDPIYQSVLSSVDAHKRSWTKALLVEASPLIAHELQRDILPTLNFTVMPRVVNEGVCPPSKADSLKGDFTRVMPFYTFPAVPGLPEWTAQVSSFSLQHVNQKVGYFSRWFRKGLANSTNRTNSNATSPANATSSALPSRDASVNLTGGTSSAAQAAANPMTRAALWASRVSQHHAREAAQKETDYQAKMKLRSMVIKQNVTCRPLASLLRRNGMSDGIGILMIDVETLDCEVSTLTLHTCL